MTATTQGSRTLYTPEKAALFLRRLGNVNGNVRIAALSLGLTREVISYWMKRYPEFKSEYRRVREGLKG